MKRIGILGGTFNPIHLGHLSIAEAARDKLGLDKVVFVPAYINPHKTKEGLISPRERYAMVRLAIKDNKFFDASDIEIKRGGKSYTIDTVRKFLAAYPSGTKFFFIIGSDNAAKLHTWKGIKELTKLVSFVVVNRAGEKKARSKVKIITLRTPGWDISGSYLRSQIKERKSIHYLVPENVAIYIEKRALYR